MNQASGRHFEGALKRPSTLLPFLLFAVGLCTVLELIFFTEVGRPAPLFLLFMWAYSQFALVELVAPSFGPVSWPRQAMLWFGCYLLLGLGLWVGLRSSKILGSTRPWFQALVAWAAAECVLGAVAVACVRAGLVIME